MAFSSFSIREYTAKMRSTDVQKCLPFKRSDELEETQLPPMFVRKFRWWLVELAESKKRERDDDDEEGEEERRKKVKVGESGDGNVHEKTFHSLEGPVCHKQLVKSLTNSIDHPKQKSTTVKNFANNCNSKDTQSSKLVCKEITKLFPVRGILKKKGRRTLAKSSCETGDTCGGNLVKSCNGFARHVKISCNNDIIEDKRESTSSQKFSDVSASSSSANGLRTKEKFSDHTEGSQLVPKIDTDIVTGVAEETVRSASEKPQSSDIDDICSGAPNLISATDYSDLNNRNLSIHKASNSHVKRKGDDSIFKASVFKRSPVPTGNGVSRFNSSCSILRIEHDIRVYIPEYLQQCIFSPPDTRSSIFSPAGAKKYGKARWLSELVSTSGDKCFNEKFHRLPLNSRGELMKLHSAGNFGVSDISKSQNTGGVPFCNFPLPDTAYHKYSANYGNAMRPNFERVEGYELGNGAPRCHYFAETRCRPTFISFDDRKQCISSNCMYSTTGNLGSLVQTSSYPVYPRPIFNCDREVESVEMRHRMSVVTSHLPNAHGNILLNSTHCKHRQSNCCCMASTFPPSFANLHLGNFVKPLPSKLKSCLSQCRYQKNAYPFSSPFGRNYINAMPLTDLSFPFTYSSSVYSLPTYKRNDPYSYNAASLAHTSHVEAYPRSRSISPSNGAYVHVIENGNGRNYSSSCVESMQHENIKNWPANRTDGFPGPVKRPNLAAHWGNYASKAQRRENFDGFIHYNTKSPEQFGYGYKTMNMDLQKLDGQPVRLKAGSKHILRPCQNMGSNNGKPIRSGLPFGTIASSREASVFLKKTRKIHRV